MTAMTGRSLHDTLLRVLSHGPLRAKLFDPPDEASTVHSDEWDILRRAPREQLHNMARFLTRHYYTERVVRLFRHVRRLAPRTGRDPLQMLDTPQAHAVYDRAELGSAQTAEDILALIQGFLLHGDTEIQAAFPYWRDLVRYHATLFRLEAVRAENNPTRFPCRSASAAIVRFEWNLPVILTQMPPVPPVDLAIAQVPSVLLMASSRDRRVISLRCTPAIQCLFEAADGTRTVEELRIVSGFSVEQIAQALEQLREIGAIQWQGGITTRS
jgi:hypothetical protein